MNELERPEGVEPAVKVAQHRRWVSGDALGVAQRR